MLGREPHTAQGSRKLSASATSFHCLPETRSPGGFRFLPCAPREPRPELRATRPAQRGRGRTEQEVKEMETTKTPLSQCVESKLQNRASLGDVSGLARSIEVNGQITPLIVAADGETYQIVAGHRRHEEARVAGGRRLRDGRLGRRAHRAGAQRREQPSQRAHRGRTARISQRTRGGRLSARSTTAARAVADIRGTRTTILPSRTTRP